LNKAAESVGQSQVAARRQQKWATYLIIPLGKL
jgi:hypothetical protein